MKDAIPGGVPDQNGHVGLANTLAGAIETPGAVDNDMRPVLPTWK